MQHLKHHDRLTSFQLRNIAAACVASRVNHFERCVPPSSTAAPVARLSAALADFAIRVLAFMDPAVLSASDMALTAKLVALPTRMGGIGLGNLDPSYCALKYYASVTAVKDKVHESAGTSDAHIRDLYQAQAQAQAAQALKPAGHASEVDLNDPHHLQGELVDLAAAIALSDIAAALPKQQAAFLRGMASPAATAIFHAEAGWNNYSQIVSVDDARWIFRLRLFIPLLPVAGACKVSGCMMPADRYGHHALSCEAGVADGCTHPKLLRKWRHNASTEALALGLLRFTRHRAQHELREGDIPVDRYLVRRAGAVSKLEADLVIHHADGPHGAEVGIPLGFFSGKAQSDKAKEQPPPGSPARPPGFRTLGDFAINAEGDVLGSGAQTAFRGKVLKYVSSYYNITDLTFMPFAVSTSGYMHPISLAFIVALCKSGDKRSTYADSVAIRKVLGGVARMVQRGNANLLRAYMFKHADAVAAEVVAVAKTAAAQAAALRVADRRRALAPSVAAPPAAAAVPALAGAAAAP
jgi:hypothetical protein